MNFEEFLKEKTKEVDSGHVPRKGCTVIKYISKEDLGNWAWDEKQKYKELAEKGSSSAITSNDIYYEIALACLGEAEIERRLEKLKGDTHE